MQTGGHFHSVHREGVNNSNVFRRFYHYAYLSAIRGRASASNLVWFNETLN